MDNEIEGRRRDPRLGPVRLITVAVGALVMAGLVRLAWLVIGRWAPVGLAIAVPALVILATLVAGVAVLVRYGLAASAGAARAATHGNKLALGLGGGCAGFAISAGGGESRWILAASGVALFALAGVLHRTARQLPDSEPADRPVYLLPPPGAAVSSEPIGIERAASSRPYPYPTPLPDAVRSAHVSAVAGHQFRAGAWSVLLLPALPLVVISLFWGLGRHGSVDSSLWATNPVVAAGLLGAGLLLAVIMTWGIVRHTRASSRHIALLAAYGIEVTTAGVQRPS